MTGCCYGVLAWYMIQDYFWLGTGLGTFYYYYTAYRSPLDASDGFFAHMDPLQFWMETGVLAPVLFYGVLLCVLLRTIRAVWAARANYLQRLEIMAPFCGLLALTLHTHLTFHLYMPGILLPLAVFLACWYVATEKALGCDERIRFQPSRSIRYAISGITVVAVLVVGGWCARAAVGIGLTHVFLADMQTGRVTQGREKLHLMGIWAPDSYPNYDVNEAKMRLLALTQNRQSLSKDQVNELYDEATFYLDKAFERNPRPDVCMVFQSETL